MRPFRGGGRGAENAGGVEGKRSATPAPAARETRSSQTPPPPRYVQINLRNGDGELDTGRIANPVTAGGKGRAGERREAAIFQNFPHSGVLDAAAAEAQSMSGLCPRRPFCELGSWEQINTHLTAACYQKVCHFEQAGPSATESRALKGVQKTKRRPAIAPLAL